MTCQRCGENCFNLEGAVYGIILDTSDIVMCCLVIDALIDVVSNVFCCEIVAEIIVRSLVEFLVVTTVDIW